MYFNWYVLVFRVRAMVTQVCATIHREQADTEEKCERM